MLFGDAALSPFEHQLKCTRARTPHPSRRTTRLPSSLPFPNLNLRSQLFGLVNTLLASDSETSKLDLSIHRYPVIPLSHNVGIVGWVPHTDTLHQLIRDYRQVRKILLNIEHRLMLQMAPKYDMLTLLQKVEVFEFALSNTTGQDLWKVLWLHSTNSEVWLERRTTYTRSLAVMSMVGYVLGLGDRHPSNLMLERFTGKVVHIDFGDCFEVAQKRDKFPEKIPFRLTRMLTNAMEVCGIEGAFRTTCESAMRVLRANRDSVLAMLEAFVHDPLINWRLVTPTAATGDGGGGGSDDGGASSGRSSVGSVVSAAAGGASVIVDSADAVGGVRGELPSVGTEAAFDATPSFEAGDRVRCIVSEETQETVEAEVISAQMRDGSQFFTVRDVATGRERRAARAQLRRVGTVGSASLSVGIENIARRMSQSVSRSYDGSDGQLPGSYHANRSEMERQLKKTLGGASVADGGSPIRGEDGEFFEALPSEELNKRAVEVKRRIHEKLTGRDFGGDDIDVVTQVERLIQQATANHNLAQCYIGWCPFW